MSLLYVCPCLYICVCDGGGGGRQFRVAAKLKIHKALSGDEVKCYRSI